MTENVLSLYASGYAGLVTLFLIRRNAMKTLRLAFSRIITYFLENKIIFVLYFIGTVASVFMMIFYYGNTLTFKTGVNNDSISFRLFQIDFTFSQNVTAEALEKLKSFEQDYDIQDIILYSVLDKNGNDTIDPEYTVEYEQGQKVYCFSGDEIPPITYLEEGTTDGNVIPVESYLYNNNDVMYNPKSNIFTDKQLKQNVTVAPKGKTENIKIQGQDFKTIRNESVSDYVIPIEKYFDSNIRTCRIEICVSERFSKDSMSLYSDFLDDWLKELYPDSAFDIKTPGTYYGSEDAANMQGFATIIAVFIVALISFMLLLKYLMDSCRRENSILMMVGAKRKRIILINLLENIILTLSSSAVAVVLHIALYDSLVTKINLYKNITYSAQDYLIIVLLAIGLSLIVQIPFIFTYWFKNIRNIKEG